MSVDLLARKPPTFLSLFPKLLNFISALRLPLCLVIAAETGHPLAPENIGVPHGDETCGAIRAKFGVASRW